MVSYFFFIDSHLCFQQIYYKYLYGFQFSFPNLIYWGPCLVTTLMVDCDLQFNLLFLWRLRGLMNSFKILINWEVLVARFLLFQRFGQVDWEVKKYLCSCFDRLRSFDWSIKLRGSRSIFVHVLLGWEVLIGRLSWEVQEVFLFLFCLWWRSANQGET